MRKYGKFLIPALIFGLVAFNITFIKSSPKTNENYTLMNISILKASASEYVCDATNSNICTIGIATGTGRLIFTP